MKSGPLEHLVVLKTKGMNKLHLNLQKGAEFHSLMAICHTIMILDRTLLRCIFTKFFAVES